MTFIEGLVVWAVIFAFGAGEAACFIRGSFYVFAQTSGHGNIEGQRTGQKAVRRVGLQYLAASIALSAVGYAIMVVAEL